MVEPTIGQEHNPLLFRVLNSFLRGAGLAFFVFVWASVFKWPQIVAPAILMQWGWPWGVKWFYVAIAAGLGMLIGALESSRLVDYRRISLEAAEILGAQHSGDFPLPPDAKGLPILAASSGCHFAITKTTREGPVTLFLSSASVNRTIVRTWVAFLSAPGFPTFNLHPMHIGWRVLRRMGTSGVKIIADPHDPAQEENIRRFNEAFHLDVAVAADCNGTSTRDRLMRASNEEAIRNWFDKAVIELLLNHPKIAIESRGGYLAIHGSLGKTEADHLVELFHVAISLRRAFQAAGTKPLR